MAAGEPPDGRRFSNRFWADIGVSAVIGAVGILLYFAALVGDHDSLGCLLGLWIYAHILSVPFLMDALWVWGVRLSFDEPWRRGACLGIAFVLNAAIFGMMCLG